MDNNKIIIAAIAFGLIVGMLKYVIKPIVKGKMGELHVARKLSGLPDDKYILLNDVMLPTNRGTTQIDHVLISIYGIFVIETKNYKGWIYGSEYSDKWTQNIYGNKKQFINPLKQNYGHICALKELLNLSEDKFISIVAFSNDATLKTKINKNVVRIKRVKRTILSYNTQIFSLEEIKDISNKIVSARVESTHSNRVEHVKKIRENRQEDRQIANSGVCPKCGGKLVDRKGKYGAFVGCSNYPKCRYTK